MARYNLIMKDETYMKLLKKCVEQGGISMGRLLNDIVDASVAEDKVEIKTKCLHCEDMPVFRGFKDGKTILLCEMHLNQEKKFLEGWKLI